MIILFQQHIIWKDIEREREKETKKNERKGKKEEKPGK
jgi:hypothetical protein